MTTIIKAWDKKEADSRREANHPIVKDYALKRITYVLKYISLKKSDRTLELGAGDGFFSSILKDHCDLTLIDSSKEMLEKNPVRHNQMIMDSSLLEFADNSFELVFEANMLHHVSDLDKVLSEMVRVTKNYLVILEPNRNNPLTIILGILKKDERESLKFSKTYLKNRLKKYNVELVHAANFGIIPANRCPKWFWNFMKNLDGVIPFWGLETIMIYRKNNGRI